MIYKGYKVENISIDDMPNEMFKDIARECGIDAAVTLLLRFAGNLISVPSNGLNKIEKKIILSEYDGDAMTIKRLAKTLFKAESSIREILKNYKIVPAENGQLSLFNKTEIKK